MERVLTKEALEFLKVLHKEFEPKRLELLERRKGRGKPGYLVETKAVREDPLWQVVKPPKALEKRHVEITGPADRKMMINALNSGADLFMVDFEDSMSPTSEHVIQGQVNLMDAVRKEISLETENKRYQLGEKIAQLVVRPRGLHLNDKQLNMSGTLVDFGLSFFHNAKEWIARGEGPFYYIPKMESYLEARFFKELFAFSERWIGIPEGSLRATALIETIWAAFQMEEILFELKEYIVGLNAGRWDYIFSIIKTYQEEILLPDRGKITMHVPFMRAYCNELVRTAHKRGAHAMGGMAAFIPNRKDLLVTEEALKRVREDKEREVQEGFDGTWVAHPDLVPLAKEVFETHLGTKPHQKGALPEKGKEKLDNFSIPGGEVTEVGMIHNVSVALRYIDAWLKGVGAVAIDNLMEDAATAEISRSQLWQWLKRSCFTKARIEEEIDKVEVGEEAKELLRELIFSDTFIDFFTLYAYPRLP